MKVRVPVIIKDPEVADYKGLPFWEEITVEDDILLDGPVSRRIAMLDFDETGQLMQGTNFIPPSADHPGRYEFNVGPLDPGAFGNWEFLRTAVFGGVYKTLSMFEEADTLGRRVKWAFPGPQLLVIPRAGEWGNAFYERESRSLQFFYVTRANGPRVYASHSQDIIGHETAHAVIDGVVPDLYDAVTPESLALHEALADLTTVLLAFRSRKLSARVLELTNGSIEKSSAFTQVAEQFGQVITHGRHAFLRDLKNDQTLSSPDVDDTDPHNLSQVLSGALYSVAVRLYDGLRGEPTGSVGMKKNMVVSAEIAQWEKAARSEDLRPLARTSALGGRTPPEKALFLATERFKRLILRGLDYLPPGDASFADYGRAVLASDEASHPGSGAQRNWLAKEFVQRGIVASPEELDTETDFQYGKLHSLDLRDLRDSDWVAYQFVERHRAWLGIKKGVPFEVHPRLYVEKRQYHRGSERIDVPELILKVGWTDQEDISAGAGLPKKRRVRKGVTLALDWNTKRVRALLRSNADRNQRNKRDAFTRALLDRDMLRLGDAALGPDGRPLRSFVPADVREGALRIKGAARLLHISGIK